MKLHPIAFASLFALGLAVGCDDTVSEKKSVETTPGGTTVTRQETVKKEADGDVVVEKKKDVDTPDVKVDSDVDDNDAKVKVKVDND